VEETQEAAMSVSDKFRTVLAELLKARHPLLLVETHEDDRAIDEIAAVATDPELRTPRTVYDWSATHGLARRGAGGKQATRAPAAALQQVMEVDEPAVVVFRDLHHALGAGGRPADPNVIRLLRDLASKFRTSPHPGCLIMVSPLSTLPPDLEKVVTIVDFALPDEDEIRALLDGMVEMNKQSGRIKVVATDEDLERLAKAAVGLTLAEAENAFARAMVNDGELSGDDIEVILEEKRQTIRKSGVLEFVRSEGGLDGVGGLENLKRWLKKRDGAWLDAAKAWGLPEPKGVLITGVPGCGKSLTARCVAGAWGLPLLRLDVGRVFAGLVGSSEQNMRSAIRTAEAIAPCVLWVDEIEKGFAGVSGASGDSGTGQRVFGTFLTWLQDKTRPVFVIATANTIDHLPPEFLRKGRFDEIFFVDLPTLIEREQIWALHLSKHYVGTLAAKTGVAVDDTLIAALAGASEGYSGAEIEQAVIAGLFDAYADRRPLERDDLLRAIANMVPLAVTQAEAISRIREWANVRAVAATGAEDAVSTTHANSTSTSRKIAEPPVEATRGGRTVDF
jgi:SpoVK/Ycf46/Vps4 family AAA+-type ATPase